MRKSIWVCVGKYVFLILLLSVCLGQVLAKNAIVVDTLPTVNGIVFNQRTGLPLAKVTVAVWDNCTDTKISTVLTDASGHIRFQLIENCCYRIQAVKETFLAAILQEVCPISKDGKLELLFQIDLQTTIGDEWVKIDSLSGRWINRKTGALANGRLGNGVYYEGGVELGICGGKN